jgi:hypothetical protein
LYGGWIWQTIVAYLVGVAVEVPFIDQEWYTGPLVKHLGGADISWIIGLVVPIVLYVALCRFWPPAGVQRIDPLAGAADQDLLLPDPGLVATSRPATGRAHSRWTTHRSSVTACRTTLSRA